MSSTVTSERDQSAPSISAGPPTTLAEHVQREDAYRTASSASASNEPARLGNGFRGPPNKEEMVTMGTGERVPREAFQAEDSIRPSESASNVGGQGNGSTWSEKRPDQDRWHPAAVPQSREWKPYAGEETSDTSGSPSQEIGIGRSSEKPAEDAWRGPPPSDDRMARAPQSPFPVETANQTSGWQTADAGSGNRGGTSSGWGGPATSEPQLHNRSTPGWNASTNAVPLPAPTPRRWDTMAGGAIDDLERAATPRADRSTNTQASQHVPDGAGRSISIMGASKYHAEGLQMKEEVSLGNGFIPPTVRCLTHLLSRLLVSRLKLPRWKMSESL